MGKIRSRKFFARQNHNVRTSREKQEREKERRRRREEESLRAEAAEAHEEVDRLEEENRSLKQLVQSLTIENEALERGNRMNQSENIQLHEALQRLRRNTKKRK